MSTFTTDVTLGNALTKNVEVMFRKGFTTAPVEARRIWNVTSTDQKHSEHDSFVYDGFASATGEGADYSASDPVKGDTLNLTQGKITDSFECTKEAGKYDKYNVVQALKGAQSMGLKTAKRIELDLQLHFGFGFGTSYTNRDGSTVSTTSSDGVALFGTHTVNGSSSTYSNTASTAFGQTGLETLESRFVGFLNHAGELSDYMPTTIFTTDKPSVINLVKEYNKGMNHIEDSDRGINTYQGKYQHVVLKYMDATATGQKDGAKDDHWGIVDAGNPNLILEVSQEPIVYEPQMVQRNRNILVQADAHYAYGVLDANCIAGCNA